MKGYHPMVVEGSPIRAPSRTIDVKRNVRSLKVAAIIVSVAKPPIKAKQNNINQQKKSVRTYFDNNQWVILNIFITGEIV